MIHVVCPSCGAATETASENAGKRGRCRCGDVFRIPEATKTITCLSIQQPYVDDIFFYGKWAENRSWKTPYRGELWIHSSRVAPGYLQEAKEDGEDARAESPTGLATGCILGKVHLCECLSREEISSIAPNEYLGPLGRVRPTFSNDRTVRAKQLLEHIDVATWDHVCDDEYVWIFSNPELLTQPIISLGKLRLWKHIVDAPQLIINAKI